MLWFYSKPTNQLINWISRRRLLKKAGTHSTRLSEITKLVSLRLKLKSKQKGEMRMTRLQLPLPTEMMMDNPLVALIARKASVVKKLKLIVRT